MFQSLIAAFSMAFADIMNRFLMSNKKIVWQKFLTVAFLYNSLLMIPIFLIFGNFNIEIFETKYLLLLAVLILISIGYSSFRNIGLKHLKIEIAEPLFLSSWIFTILFAFIFFPSERNLLNTMLALIASLSVFIISFEKKHLKFNKFYFFILMSSLFAGIQAIVLKKLLEVYDPISLTFIRWILIAFVFLLLVRITRNDVIKNSKYYLLLGILDISSMIFVLWSYNSIGIILTTLIISLYPLISEWLSSFLLKEKLHWKNVIVTFIIITCIIISIIGSNF